MNSFKLVIICQLFVRYVQSHYGTCSNLQLPMNAKGKICKYINLVNSFFFIYFLMNIRCRNKIHKEHVDNNDPLAPCKLHHDPHSAREMLLLAVSSEDQNRWVSRLSKRIQKCGYKANSTSNSINNADGTRISPR